MSTEEVAFPDDHYIVLSRMVVAFQSLEQAITYGLAFLMQPNDRGQALGFIYTVLNKLPFANRLKLLSNYVETRSLTHFVPPGTQYEEGEGGRISRSLGETPNRNSVSRRG